MGLYNTYLIFVQVDMRNVPADDTESIVTLAASIVANTIAPIEFESLLHGIDCNTLIYSTHDVEQSLKQIALYLTQAGIIHYIKLAWALKPITFTTPMTNDFDFLYINTLGKDS